MCFLSCRLLTCIIPAYKYGSRVRLFLLQLVKFLRFDLVAEPDVRSPDSGASQRLWNNLYATLVVIAINNLAGFQAFMSNMSMFRSFHGSWPVKKPSMGLGLPYMVVWLWPLWWRNPSAGPQVAEAIAWTNSEWRYSSRPNRLGSLCHCRWPVLLCWAVSEHWDVAREEHFGVFFSWVKQMFIDKLVYRL